MIHDLPYRKLKAGIDYVKKRWYIREWRENHSYTIEYSPERIEQDLRHPMNGFEGMYISYYYANQEFDLRRPIGLGSDGDQLELHVRGRHTPGTLEPKCDVMAHIEKSRYEHKSDHINGVGSRWLTQEEVDRLCYDWTLPEVKL